MAIVREGLDFIKIRDSRGVERYKDAITGLFVNKEVARFTRDIKNPNRYIDLQTGRFVKRDLTVGFKSGGKRVLSESEYASYMDKTSQRIMYNKILKKFERKGFKRSEALQQTKQQIKMADEMGLAYEVIYDDI